MRRACQGYLLRVGPGLRACLLESRENGSLRWVATVLWCRDPCGSPRVSCDCACFMTLVSLKLEARCFQMLSLLRLLLQRHFSDPLPSSYVEHVMFRGLHMQANTHHAHVGNLCFSAALAVVKPGSGLRECSQVVWMKAGLARFVGVKAA